MFLSSLEKIKIADSIKKLGELLSISSTISPDYTTQNTIHSYILLIEYFKKSEFEMFYDVAEYLERQVEISPNDPSFNLASFADKHPHFKEIAFDYYRMYSSEELKRAIDEGIIPKPQPKFSDNEMILEALTAAYNERLCEERATEKHMQKVREKAEAAGISLP